MGIGDMDGVDLNLQSCFFRKFEALGNAAVILLDTKQASHNGTVSAVPGTSHCKRTMEADFGLDRAFTEEFAGNQPNPHCTGSMRAGWPDHDRTNDVEQFHFA